MFDRSRAHVFVRTADSRAVVTALDRWFRRWDYRRRAEPVPSGYPADRHQEVREWFVRVVGPWTVLAPEDVAEVLAIAYAVHKADPDTPVIASRAYKGGDWDLKAYHERDLVFKVGDDRDDELKWVGRPLDDERVPEVLELFGGGPAFEDFLKSVVRGRPDPRDLVDGLGLSSLSVGFEELAADPPDGWDHLLWVHRTSPLWR